MESDQISDIIPEEEYSFNNKPRLTTQYMTSYEYASILSFRSLQLITGSKPKINIDENSSEKNYSSIYDPLSIAKKELEAGLLNLVIRRKLPNEETEDWYVNDLVFPKF